MSILREMSSLKDFQVEIMGRLFLDVILSTNEEIDEKMGYKSLDNLSFPFKLSFNTLIEYKIIKEVN